MNSVSAILEERVSMEKKWFKIRLRREQPTTCEPCLCYPTDFGCFFLQNSRQNNALYFLPAPFSKKLKLNLRHSKWDFIKVKIGRENILANLHLLFLYHIHFNPSILFPTRESQVGHASICFLFYVTTCMNLRSLKIPYINHLSK